jgi:aryl-alcohol dehydrogenase-like predicted oxidoreductase
MLDYICKASGQEEVMEKRILGKTGMECSVLGFGGAEIGFNNIALKTVIELLSAAIDEGLNVIDTAECYQGSEELIGNAIGHRRKDFFLFTKCGHGARYDVPEWEPEQIARSIERSLKRLKTDCVDLLQLHSCDEATLRKGAVIEVLQKARKDGKTRFIGYSGDGQAARYAIETGAFDTLQTSVSIADQEALELTLPLARQRGMGVIAKRPIANAAWRTGNRPSDPYAHPYWERLQKLQYDFINGNPAESFSRALRFTLSSPGVHTAIVGTTRPGRWRENANLIAKGQLTTDEFNSIRSRWQQVAAPDWVGQV